MGNLPKDRVRYSSPFSVTGVDYAGPFLIRDRKGRGSRLTKVYICLFICFVTKCIHLELVSQLSTEAFIATLRRFVSRRGYPTKIYSDNGRNFVGAQKHLKELGDFLTNTKNSISEALLAQGINWCFSPPYSPHFVGIWEAGVKSIKYHLRRSLPSQSFVYEEFLTLIVQIEAILNSRPLYPLSSDPNDFNPLTPAHFTVGRPLTMLADPNLDHIKESRLALYQRIQAAQWLFWKKWYVDYINHLQTRVKWKTAKGHVSIGTMVLLRDANAPPACWKVARVVETHPGTDGVVRVVTLKTPSGITKRAVSTIVPLPVPISDGEI